MPSNRGYYWLCPSSWCRKFVQATLCPGEPDPGYPLYVHEDDLPETTQVFLYDDVCWTINPAGARSCRPKNSHRVAPAYDYETCADCVERNEEGGQGDQPSGGYEGDGSGDGGPPNAGGGAGGRATGAGEGESGPWRKAAPCAAHSGRSRVKDLYALSSGVTEEKIFRYSEICYTISPSSPEYSTLPAGGVSVTVYGDGFDDCSDCANGVQAALCPDQESPGLAPDLWVSLSGLPEATRRFRHSSLLGTWCYELNPAGSPAVIPEDAVILAGVPDEYESCSACGPGRQATLCPDQNDPGYEIWVRAEHLPAEDTIIWRERGVCWSIAPGETTMIPPGVKLAISPDQTAFASCADCLCGLPVYRPQGVRVLACGGQDAGGWLQYFVREADVPGELWVWRLADEICAYVSPSMPLMDLPINAILVKPQKQYSACFECTDTDSGGDGGGRGRGSRPPFTDSEGNPIPPIPPSPVVYAHEFLACEGGAGTGVYTSNPAYPVGYAVKPTVDVNTPGGGHLTAGQCYKVGADAIDIHNLAKGSMPTFGKQVYVNCAACLGVNPCTQCNGAQNNIVVSVNEGCGTYCQWAGQLYVYVDYYETSEICRWRWGGAVHVSFDVYLTYTKATGVYSVEIYSLPCRVFYSAAVTVTCNPTTHKLSFSTVLPGENGMYWNGSAWVYDPMMCFDPTYFCAACTASVSL